MPFTYHLQALWAMSRPMQLLSIILVYLLGSLVAQAHGFALNVPNFLYGMVVLLLVSASIHYANEYADYETDCLTNPTQYSGGSRALIAGNLPRELALIAAWSTLVAGLSLAVVFYLQDLLTGFGLLFLIIGAFGGWMYSLPPLQLAWRGWGELDNAFLGAMLLPLYGYVVQAGTFNWHVVIIFLPFMLLDFLNLLATTWPDRSADGQVGKFTLATQHPVAWLRRLYCTVAVMTVICLVLCGKLVYPLEVGIISFFVLPFVWWGFSTYTRIENPQPSVMAMVALLMLQIIGWGLVGVSI